MRTLVMLDYLQSIPPVLHHVVDEGGVRRHVTLELVTVKLIV